MGVEMNKPRMGGMKLSAFGMQPSKSDAETPPQPDSSPEPGPAKTEPEAKPAKAKTDSAKGKPATPAKKGKRNAVMASMNIKIQREQQQWLQATAQQVRDNNDTPVSPSERCYPQHLVGAAIDLLQAADVDWRTIKTAEDLRKALDL